MELASELDELAQVAAERVWSLVSGPNGSVYVGTGDGGHVFAVDEDGETSLLFDSPEIAVHALALSADGVLYAGTAPEGIIYRIPPDGDAEVLARTGTHYVWDLELDDSGALLAEMDVRVGFVAPNGRPRRQPENWLDAFGDFMARSPGAYIAGRQGARPENNPATNA